MKIATLKKVDTVLETMQSLLNTLPSDEVFTMGEATEKLQYPFNNSRKRAKFPQLTNNARKILNNGVYKWVLGSEPAIQNLDQLTASQGAS